MREQRSPTWGWALVEIRADGTWGEPQVVPAPGTPEAPLAGARTTVPSSITELSEMLKKHLAAERIGDSGRGAVAEVLLRGAEAATIETRSRFLGPLAHVEALQGHLRRAELHAAQVLSGPPAARGAAGLPEAQHFILHAHPREGIEGAERLV